MIIINQVNPPEPNKEMPKQPTNPSQQPRDPDLNPKENPDKK